MATPTACVAPLSYQRAFTSIISLTEGGRRPLSLCSLTDKVPEGPAEPSVFSPVSTQDATAGSAPFRDPPGEGKGTLCQGPGGGWLPYTTVTLWTWVQRPPTEAGEQGFAICSLPVPGGSLPQTQLLVEFRPP